MNLDAYESYLQIKRSVKDKLTNCDSTQLANEAKNQLNLIEDRLQGAVDRAIQTQIEHLVSINLLLLADAVRDS